MCGRTAVSLNKDDITRACQFRSRNGRRIQPRWRKGTGAGARKGAGAGKGAGARKGADDSPRVTADGREDDFEAKDIMEYRKGYNVPPGSKTPVLVAANHFEDEEAEKTDDLDVVITPMKWGLIPSWHHGDGKEFSFKTSNCRSDSMLSKNMFKQPLEKGRRCVVIADGFYEWKTDEKTKVKQPYFFYFPRSDESAGKTHNIAADKEEDWKGPRLLTMAGIFDKSHSNDSDESVYSYTIITTNAAPDVSPIHHRMPAILDGDEEVLAWLNHDEVPLKTAVDFIKPKSCLKFHPVSSFVNKVGNDSTECVNEIDISKKSRSGTLMSNWLKRKTEKSEFEPVSKVAKSE